MSRYRLDPTPEKELILLRHCSDARYVWNLCVEQEAHWRPGRGRMPGFAERCRHIALESRESQALFRCVACNYTVNADVNAARNIAAGHAVTARGGGGISQPVNREPQLALLAL
jgi:putative transposase